MHPQGGSSNFADLAAALAMCCGLSAGPKEREGHAQAIARAIGGEQRKHVIFVLCDGMGCNVLEKHLESDKFLHAHNDPNRLVSVFPSTTPAALTTLATAAWPGRHGMPGWDLRDQKGCEFPGQAGPGPVQLRCLHKEVTDMRSHKPASEMGFGQQEVYKEAPWTGRADLSRRMLFVNAYNSTGFTDWYQGANSANVQNISETCAETLGTLEGSEDALRFFATGVDRVIDAVESAERDGQHSYTYLYTAHPDKHMHPLGTDHPEVRKVVRGLDSELARLWQSLRSKDATLVVTADHGHVTVDPCDMVTLPDELLACLEYANVGVHGKGRHAPLHVRAGRRGEFEALWAVNARLRESFLLLDVDDAAAEGLFGPEPPRPDVRPRLGDYLVLSLGAATLVTPKEAKSFRDGEARGCQGAHGSLLREEMRIPFVLCTPEGTASRA